MFILQIITHVSDLWNIYYEYFWEKHHEILSVNSIFVVDSLRLKDTYIRW